MRFTPRQPCAAALIALALVPGAASAHPPTTAEPGAKKPSFDARQVPAQVDRALGGKVMRTPDGAYRVDVRVGPDVFTHGPDPKTPELSGGPAPEADPFAGRFGSEPVRAPECVQPAQADGDYYQHVIYMRRPSTPDEYSALKADIQEEIAQMNYLLNQSSIASGGPTADYKVLCDGTGGSIADIRVSELVSDAARTFNGVTSAARAAGYDEQNVDYTIFYDGPAQDPGQCGVGGVYPTSSGGQALSANNPNNLGNVHGITWRNCWDGITAMHENGHNQGAVQYDAPHSTGDGMHCFDHSDVMCYNDGGNLDPGPPLASDHCSAGTLVFDCGFNTYFDANTEGGEYLASNWNIGSELNRFIEFGSTTGNDEPTAAFAHGCSASLECEFTDQSSDDGTIASRSWDFGDGQGSADEDPAHQYAAAGTYQVSLEVTDDQGATGSVQVPVSIGPGSITKLRNGVPVDTAAGAQGAFDRYSFRVPRHAKNLKIKLTGEQCVFVGGGSDLCVPDLDLYVATGFEPTLEEFDCRPFRHGITETCSTARPRRARLQIGVYNYAATPGTDYAIVGRYRRAR
jgi:hypothetical protein